MSATEVDSGTPFRGTFTPVIKFGDQATGEGAGTISWMFVVDDADLDDLAEGEQLEQVYDVTVTDNVGATATIPVTITITGTNDAPTIESTEANDFSGMIIETEGVTGNTDTLSEYGSIYFEDVDLLDEHDADVTEVIVEDNFIGELTTEIVFDSTGGGSGQLDWTYTVQDSDLDFLTEGQQVVQTYNIRIHDYEGGGEVFQPVTITITGTNDIAVITGTSTGEVTEDSDPTTLATSGTLGVEDVDTGEQLFKTVVSPVGTPLGTLEINESGIWDYSVDNTLQAIQDLDDGVSLVDSFQVESLDGSATQQIDITIKGVTEVILANVAPVITRTFESITITEFAEGHPDEGSNVFHKGTDYFEYTDANVLDKHSLVASQHSVNGVPAHLTSEGLLGFLEGGHLQTATGGNIGAVEIIFRVRDNALDFLSEGQLDTRGILFSVVDPAPSYASLVFYFNAIGANDRPETDGISTGHYVTELADGDPDENVADLMITGTFNFNGIDLLDTHTVMLLGAEGNIGLFEQTSFTDSTNTGTGSIGWQFTINDSQLDTLGEGVINSQFFDFWITDNHGLSVIGTVQIDLIGTNDAPIIATNLDLYGLHDDVTNTEVTLTSAHLNATDSDAPSLLTYTIDDGLSQGSLYNSDTDEILIINDTFTQDDINNGFISYKANNPNLTTDSFDFTVADSDGGSTTSTFFVQIGVNIETDDALSKTDHNLSLREAVILANGSVNDESILLESKSYGLSLTGVGEDLSQTGDLDIINTSNLISIIGTGMSTISGQQVDRVFHVATDAQLTIDSISLEEGNLIQVGAIYNSGELIIKDAQLLNNRNGALYNALTGKATIEGSSFKDNESLGSGGAIYNLGNLNITETDFITNESITSNGGAIFNETTGNLSISGSSIESNKSFSAGGGIANRGTVSLIDSTTIENNSSNNGGGLANFDFGKVSLIDSSTISSNTAIVQGGGIFNGISSQVTSVINSTISGNTASEGGGVDNWGSIRFDYSTIAFNNAFKGDGILSHDAINSPVFLGNSIVAQNTNNDDLEGEKFYSNGYNYVGSTQGALISFNSTDHYSTSNSSALQAVLDPTLSLNGSTVGTKTHALLSDYNNAAIDGANPTSTVMFDQRNSDRPVDGLGNSSANNDIGAYELQDSVSYAIQVTTTDDEYSAYNTTLSLAANHTNFLTSGMGLSLREAVELANHSTSDATITFLHDNARHTLTITGSGEDDNKTGDLDITNTSSVIRIQGIENLVIDGNGTDRIFDVGTNSELILDDVIIIGGQIVGFGGAINNAGALTINNSALLSNNATSHGGGIYNSSTGVLTINETILDDNSTLNSGGGLYNNGSVLSINSSTFESNFSGIGGGGIYNNATITLIENSTIYDNETATGGSLNDGGGINNFGTIVQIRNSTFSGNFADNDGGGIYNSNTARINNIDHSTIAFNNAEYGDGIYNQGEFFGSAAGIVNLSNTIVAQNGNNNDLGSTIRWNSAYTAISTSGYNYIGSASQSGFTGTTGDHFGTDASPLAAVLNATLALNGSLNGTKTHALLLGTDAIDGANPNSDLTVTTDQRGFVRPSGAHSDIGAYESGAVIAPIILDLNGDAQINLLSSNDSGVVVEQNGQSILTGWAGPEDGFLMYDQDQNQAFSGIEEIAFVDYHPDATTDLEGLRLAFDSNNDHVFDAQDELWSDFGIWQDSNTNGLTEEGEYKSLIEMDILSINLDSDGQVKHQDGNIIHGIGEYTLGSGEIKILGDVTLLGEPLEQSDVLVDGVEPESLEQLLMSTSEASFEVSNIDEAPMVEPLGSSFEEAQVVEQMVQAAQQDQGGLT